jgi:ribose transport system substrate-binding protein
MLLAVRSRGMAGKVHFAGFDASPGLLEALSKGEMDGLVVQNPMKMGYLGVKTMVAHLRGESVPKVIDTGVTMVTAENMDEPGIKSLIQPDFSKYLDR